MIALTFLSRVVHGLSLPVLVTHGTSIGSFLLPMADVLHLHLRVSDASYHHRYLFEGFALRTKEGLELMTFLAQEVRLVLLDVQQVSMDRAASCGVQWAV